MRYLIDVNVSPDIIYRVMRGIIYRVRIRIEANIGYFNHKVQQVVSVSLIQF